MKYRYIAFILLGGLFAPASNAQGILTYDPTNIAQTTISAQQAVEQTARQLQQYQTQLQQLQNQLQNTANPPQFVWDDANTTINNILNTLNTLNTYKDQAGSLGAYLDQFSTANHYQASCLGTGGCTSEQIKGMNANQYIGSDSQKTANDNMIRNLDKQQQQLQDDAQNLIRLQQNAQSSTGQMQALQAANQLASNQAVQLMQIRALLVAAHTAEATRAQVIADREAKERAAHDAFVGPRPVASPPYNILNYKGD